MSEVLAHRRNFGLDAARALAITAVFIVHAFTLNGIPVVGDFRTGVDLFFVLSGFLIGRIYFRSHAQGTFAIGPFWLSRWWRTLPPYFIALGLHATLGHWIAELHVRWYYLLFLQNEIGMHGFPPSWSLCVEEHFYLLLPILCGLFLALFNRKHFVWLLPVIFFLPLAGLYLSAVEPGWLLWRSPVPQGFMTQFHCEGLIGGVWLAFVFVERQELWLHLRAYARFAWWLIPITLLVDPVKSFGRPTETIYALGFVASVRMLYDWHWEPASFFGRRSKRAVTGLAMAAYSIYLCHYFAFQILRSHVLSSMHRGILKSLLVISASFCFCILFYFTVERPSILTRDRFIAHRRRLLAGIITPKDDSASRGVPTEAVQ